MDTIITSGAEGIVVGLIISFMIVLIVLLFISSKAGRKSGVYRKYITDIFVVGKIKQFAEKENVNLDEIEKSFNKYISFSRKSYIRDLDDKIELELMEKIDKDLEEKKKK